MSHNVENLSPQVIKSVAKEMAELIQKPPEGIKILQNDDDVTDIQAIIDGPAGTPYSGGAFHMKLVLNSSFPAEPPKGFFVTKIFHPNVASNGEICVNTLKKDWKPDLGLKHVLLVIKCLLIHPNPESALNEEAGRLLLEQYEDFCAQAKVFTEIHARSNAKHKTECDDGAGLSKKERTEKKLPSKKKTNDKKKNLKRL